MPALRSQVDQRFWQELLIDLFRVPIRLALRLHRSSYDGLMRLFKIAFARELVASGYNQDQAAVLAKTSSRNIRLLLGAETKPHPEGTFAERILNRVAEGPASEIELADLARSEAEECHAAWILDLLVKQGLLTRVRTEDGILYRMGPEYARIFSLRPDVPLEGDEPTLRIAFLILEALSVAPETLDGLCAKAALRTQPKRVIRGALGHLRAKGLIERYEEGDDTWYRLALDKLQLVPDDAQTRLRSGLTKFVDAFAQAVWAMATARDPSTISQRTFLYDARLEDLLALHERHEAETRALIHDAHDRAHAIGEGKRCLLMWMSCPTEEREG